MEKPKQAQSETSSHADKMAEVRREIQEIREQANREAAIWERHFASHASRTENGRRETASQR